MSLNPQNQLHDLLVRKALLNSPKAPTGRVKIAGSPSKKLTRPPSEGTRNHQDWKIGAVQTSLFESTPQINRHAQNSIDHVALSNLKAEKNKILKKIVMLNQQIKENRISNSTNPQDEISQRVNQRKSTILKKSKASHQERLAYVKDQIAAYQSLISSQKLIDERNIQSDANLDLGLDSNKKSILKRASTSKTKAIGFFKKMFRGINSFFKKVNHASSIVKERIQSQHQKNTTTTFLKGRAKTYHKLP